MSTTAKELLDAAIASNADNNEALAGTAELIRVLNRRLQALFATCAACSPA